MKLDEAIRAAIEYEGRVHRTYLEAMEKATDEAGRRVFKTLCDEEKSHLKYLHDRLEEWKKSGKINVVNLGTSIPTRESIDDGVRKLKSRVSQRSSGRLETELELLRKALKVEEETSNFYKDMVRTLDAEGREMFQRFVEIEEGHQAIVQAEIDCVSGTGYWFDTKEFDLELG